MTLPFDSIHRHGCIRIAVCIPQVRLGNPSEKARRTLVLAQRAQDAHATIALFPELDLSGYSNDDLFQQDALRGAPLRREQELFNCAIAIPDCLVHAEPRRRAVLRRGKLVQRLRFLDQRLDRMAVTASP